MKRRDFIAVAAATSSLSCLSHSATAEPSSSVPRSIPLALNTSTVRGHKLSVPDQIKLTAEAGYDGIEPWIRDLRAYLDHGGTLVELKKRIDDSGLTVVSAIGFSHWIVDDETKRKAGLDEARRDMALIRALGGKHIAAPPVGAHKPNLDSPSLDQIADRYRALCEVGAEMGVHPQLELWGFSPNLHKLAEVAYVSAAAAHPMGCVLPDFYHIYKGGNDFESLATIEASKMHCFHINDYPADIPIQEIADKDRVFPGDGDCDLVRIIRQLVNNGFSGTFSLELFNPNYWQRDAVEVMREGLLKSRAVLDAAIA